MIERAKDHNLLIQEHLSSQEVDYRLQV